MYHVTWYVAQGGWSLQIIGQQNLCRRCNWWEWWISCFLRPLLWAGMRGWRWSVGKCDVGVHRPLMCSWLDRILALQPGEDLWWRYRATIGIAEGYFAVFSVQHFSWLKFLVADNLSELFIEVTLANIGMFCDASSQWKLHGINGWMDTHRVSSMDQISRPLFMLSKCILLIE